MMKKKLLLCSLVASLMITSVLVFNSCDKDKENDEMVPTVDNVIVIDRDEDLPLYYICPYCGDTLPPIVAPYTDYNPSHIHWFLGPNDSLQDCTLPNNTNFCRYLQEGRRHRHRIRYFRESHDGYDGGIYNQWHVGGYGSGGN